MDDLSFDIDLNSANASYKDLTKGLARWNISRNISLRGMKPYAGCHQFSFTNNFINISAAIGNNILYYSNNYADPTNASITIPDGMYTVSTLNDFLSQWQTLNLAGEYFTLGANVSINRCYFTFTAAGVGYFVYFDTDSPYTLLGYTVSTAYPPVTYNAGGGALANYYAYGDAVPTFDSDAVIYVRCNIIDNSVLNGNTDKIIYTTVRTASPGYIQADIPYYIRYTNANILTGTYSFAEVQLFGSTGPLSLTEDFSIGINVKAMA